MVLFLLPVMALAQVLPPERITDWSLPGSRPPFTPTTTVVLTDHGADPTGAQPSDQALQAAIAALGGAGEVFVPAGTYRFDQTILLPDSIIIQGEWSPADPVPTALFRLQPGANAHGIRIAGRG